MGRFARTCSISAMAALAACASAPTHYYTLLPPATDSTAPSASIVDLATVAVPAEDDQAAWVVRVGPGELAVLDSERWAAPLGDELRAAFADALGRELGTDVHISTNHEPRYRVGIEVRRFESVPGQYALVEADWTIGPRNATTRLACSSRVSENVEPGYPALAVGHQRAVAVIAAQIAAAVRSMQAGAPACPAKPQGAPG
ncbi:MAG TPA: PqiC family protein [Rudaea sp.]|nr:PqiC family protein [Rudaea sp.]